MHPAGRKTESTPEGLPTRVAHRGAQRASMDLSRRQLLGHAVTLVAALPVLGACGDGPGGGAGGASAESALAELQEMTGRERQRFLEEEAAKEGQVVLYSADDPVLLRNWEAAFNKRYPKVEARLVRMTVPQVLQKAMTEAQTKRPVADLLHVNAESLNFLLRDGLLARYRSPESKGFAPEYVDAKHRWTVEWMDQYVAAFNTDKIERADVPKTLEDLTQPHWRGKLAMPSVGGPLFTAGVLTARGEPKGRALLKKLATQDVRLYESNTALGNALTSGEVAVGFGFLLQIAAKIKGKGAPVDWTSFDPLIPSLYYHVLMHNAPNPHAAALLYDWILSKDGQFWVKQDRLLGPRDDVEYPAFQSKIFDQAQKSGTAVKLPPTLFKPGNPYTDIYNDLFIRK